MRLRPFSRRIFWPLPAPYRMLLPPISSPMTNGCDPSLRLVTSEQQDRPIMGAAPNRGSITHASIYLRPSMNLIGWQARRKKFSNFCGNQSIRKGIRKDCIRERFTRIFRIQSSYVGKNVIFKKKSFGFFI